MLSLFRRTPAPLPASLDVRDGNTVYRVALRRNANARRYSLRVRPQEGDIVLTMPTRGSLVAAKDFAERHVQWIATRLRALDTVEGFVDGASVPLRGIAHRIENRPQARGTVKVEEGVLAVAGQPEFLNRRLTDWLKKQALADLTKAVERHVATAGARYKAISIKDTTSRWGSCAADGSLAFSWRLILAPPFVLDYLAAHEVAHLKELNHSVRFWRLCKTLCPLTEEARAWLKVNGNTLHRYGRG